MDLSDRIKDTRLRVMNAVHGGLLAVSGGRVGATLGNMPVYRVTTTGRVSGRARTVLLTMPVHRDDQHVFVASKGGDDRDPDWYRNMVATPTFTIEPVDGGDAVTLVARTASTEEKAELWPLIVEAYRGYGRYQDGTDRDIPVVIGEPPA